MKTNKIRNHYDNLKVARDAPREVIQAAYRALAKKHHPDISNSADASRVMQIINDAWATLGDPKKRAQHDAWIASMERPFAPDQINGTPYSAPGGKSMDSWNSAPQPPNHKNHKNPFVNPKAYSKERSSNTRKAKDGAEKSAERSWNLGLVLKVGAAFFIFITAVNLLELAPSPGPSPAPASPSAPARMAATGNTEPKSSISGPTVQPNRPLNFTTPELNIPQLKNITPPTISSSKRFLQNGVDWPTATGYVDKMPRLARGGYSEITVDNTENNDDVYVKLCFVSSGRCEGLRHVYIKQGSSFKINGIYPGVYEIRYANLRSHYLGKSEPIALTEDSQSYSVVTLTLYSVVGGNTQFTRLNEENF